MTDETTADVGPPDERGDPESVWGRFVRWLADLGFWTIFGGGIVLGFVADRYGFELLAFVCFLGAGLLPILLGTVSREEHGYDYEVSNRERLRFVVSTLRWAITPWGLLAQGLQLGGNVVPYLRYRGRLPDRDRHAPETALTAPFDGEWTTVNGGVTAATSHSWGLVAQRYAYDFLVTDADGETHDGDGDELTDYYAFGEPIRAPAGGRVVAVADSLRDYPKPGSGWTEWRTGTITGNHVVIEHADGEYSLLAHLQQDSVPVAAGDRVERGEVVGRCGNSGNTGEPHLHYQLQDHPNFWIAAGLVPRFRDVTVERDDDRADEHEPYAERERRETVYLWAGDRVRAAGDESVGD